MGGEDHRASLYTDDVLIFMSKPLQSIPILLECISYYSSLSGYKINLSKSTALPLNLSSLEHLKLISSFQISEQGFRYLGIFVTGTLNDLIKNNYNPLIEKIKLNLKNMVLTPD